MSRLTLHEAIANVLRWNSSPMSSSDIARAVNHAGFYQRADAKPIQVSQVSARVNNYPQLFKKVDGLIAICSNVIGESATASATSQSVPAIVAQESAMFAPLGAFNLEFLGELGALCSSGLPKLDWLEKCGVYAIATPANYESEFVSIEQTKAAGNVIRPWAHSKLQAKWVSGTRVVYIGLAGRHNPRKLSTRLRELLRHANGATTSSGPHKGGEIVWQLAKWGQFELYGAPTGDPPIPRTTEIEMIDQFCEQHGKLPFGNRQQ